MLGKMFLQNSLLREADRCLTRAVTGNILSANSSAAAAYPSDLVNRSAAFSSYPSTLP